MERAALVDRRTGRGRGAFGTGGGRAATCGDAASAETGSPVGTTTGGASLKSGAGCCCFGSGAGRGPERADIMAWRWEARTSGERRDERARQDNMDGASEPPLLG